MRDKSGLFGTMFGAMTVAAVISAALLVATPVDAVAASGAALASLEGGVVIESNTAQNITAVGGGQLSAGPVSGRLGKTEPTVIVNGAVMSGSVKGGIVVSGNTARNVTCVGTDCVVNGFWQK